MTSSPESPNKAQPLRASSLKINIAHAMNWEIKRTGIALTHLADSAGVDRAALSEFLSGKRRLYSDAIDRLMGVLHLRITFDQTWKAPEHLLPDNPGPAPAPRKIAKRRTRPNNKPR